jgi:hypothetical protein
VMVLLDVSSKRLLRSLAIVFASVASNYTGKALAAFHTSSRLEINFRGRDRAVYYDDVIRSTLRRSMCIDKV